MARAEPGSRLSAPCRPAHSQALLDACASVRRDFMLEATLPHFRLVNFQILQVDTGLVLHC